DPHAGRVVIVAERGVERLPPERPVELMRLAPGRGGSDRQREHLLLPRRQAVAEAPDQLGGGRLHRGMGRLLLLRASGGERGEAVVRIAGGQQGGDRVGDGRLVIGRHQVHEHRRGGGGGQRRLVRER